MVVVAFVLLNVINRYKQIFFQISAKAKKLMVAAAFVLVNCRNKVQTDHKTKFQQTMRWWHLRSHKCHKTSKQISKENFSKKWYGGTRVRSDDDDDVLGKLGAER